MSKDSSIATCKKGGFLCILLYGPLRKRVKLKLQSNPVKAFMTIVCHLRLSLLAIPYEK